ncbi:MAG: toll/interleukin-1 receptor domain-containing protein, partial [Anaerolineales bacterium]|nr:toll/interleukin-1 receptor domain-containing protein [Anaerolineales bacterium]
MTHDVFISYSSKDKAVADAVCATIENRKVRCWIAPRDVPPGLPYAAALVNAINDSKVFVLVLSKGSNSSGAVMREVEEAVDTGIPIIPLRIEDIEPTAAMRYYIKSLHWIDAMSPPLEKHLGKLADSVLAIMGVGEDDQPLFSESETVMEAPAKKRWPLPTWATALLVLAAVVIVGGGIWVVSQLGPATDETNSTDVVSPTEVAATGDALVDPTDAATTPDDESDWRPLSFMIPNPQIWEESGEDRYTAIGQKSFDAFAWSTESFEGDLLLRLDLESPFSQSEGCIIIYGDGHEHSYGSLIFCVESEFYQLEKHTRYHEGENFLAYSPSNIEFKDEIHSVMIEIIDDVASMYVDGEKVISTFFDSEEIDRDGRIGLHKLWVGSEITFSNILISRPGEEDQDTSTSMVDELKCQFDHGTELVFYTLEIPFNPRSVQVDGEISSIDEWSDAACVDLRMHYSVYYDNPNIQRIHWWVQNNEQEISFLVRIPRNLVPIAIFVNYFWPEYTG